MAEAPKSSNIGMKRGRVIANLSGEGQVDFIAEGIPIRIRLLLTSTASSENISERGMQMVQFNDWCASADGQVGNHFRRVMTGQVPQLVTGIQATAAVVPSHYASEEHMARALRRLGKPAAASLIEAKLPTTKAIRSGDLGEIYATEWIDAHSGGYHAPIERLRWKDHRNMAMRGEDVIGILQDPQTQL